MPRDLYSCAWDFAALNVGTVITFSGCPGADAKAVVRNLLFAGACLPVVFGKDTVLSLEEYLRRTGRQRRLTSSMSFQLTSIIPAI